MCVNKDGYTSDSAPPRRWSPCSDAPDPSTEPPRRPHPSPPETKTRRCHVAEQDAQCLLVLKQQIETLDSMFKLFAHIMFEDMLLFLISLVNIDCFNQLSYGFD